MNRPSWIGQTLGGRYRIDEIIGQGGMSAVYKAFDPNLKRVVAIKLIHSHLADDPKFLVRFEEEATAVAQLRHPNIVQVYDFNHDDNLYYMVQEFLAGETLQDNLRRLNKVGRRMPLKDAIQAIIQMCNATGYAHRRGMIHRDIKPANIMLDVQGEAILMDFGIVKMTGGERHTATGAVVGTALYLPPELIRGEQPDGRSDMYSLGVTMFEMVNGKPPYDADSAMTLMMMHLNDPVPNLHGLRPDVPEDLIAVIEKAMAKKRDERYAAMSDLAAALSAVLSRLESASPSATVAEGMASPTPSAAGSVAATAAAATAANATAAAAPAADPAGGTLLDSPPVTPAQAGSQSQSPGAMPTIIGGAAFRQASQNTPESPPAEQESVATVPEGPKVQQTPMSDRTIIEPRRSYTTAGMAGVAGAASQAQPAADVPARAAGGAAGGRPPTPTTAPQAATPPFWRKNRLIIIIAACAVLLVLVGLGAWLATRGGGDEPEATQAAILLPTSAEATQIGTATAPLPVVQPPTQTPAPVRTPTPTLSPTPTIPFGVPYVVIREIALSSDGSYLVNYETFEYLEKLPGEHVHFFFDTVDPLDAGRPGAGPWILWGGPRPFDGYRQSDRPKAAVQMCSLVANPDHSVKLNSGTCMILPDVNVAAPFADMACLSGADLGAAPVEQIDAGQPVLVLGLSPDEAWWNVASPSDFDQDCWLPVNATSFSGDMSTLALVEPPPAPGAGLFVNIRNIFLDSQGQYVVEFAPSGFSPALPGTHIHFFFDTFSADQVGSTGGGNRKMYGGSSPFTGFAPAERPAGAQHLCALVANPDHSVIPNSGNCFGLP